MSIEVTHVTKSFGNVTALSAIDLTLASGKIYGLLGRNGAGKTTLLNLITNRLYPTEGEITIDGMNAQTKEQAQGLVYFMSEKSMYPESMRVKDIFKWTKCFYAGNFDEAYAQKLCQLFSLDTKKRVKQLSTGYTSIYKIIIALSLNVPYLLLDEPVLGLDANHRDIFYRTLVENYTENPRTIVISTHLIEEVAGIIEDAVIIKNGRIIKNQSTQSLLQTGYTVTGAKPLVESYIAGKTILSSDLLGGLMTVCVEGTPDKASLPTGLTLSGLDLQKLFIRLTNQ